MCVIIDVMNMIGKLIHPPHKLNHKSVINIPVPFRLRGWGSTKSLHFKILHIKIGYYSLSQKKRNLES